MTGLDVIEGGDGMPLEPDWSLLFSDANELTTAHEHWSTVVTTMRSAETLTVANGHAIKRLVLAQVVFDRACVAIARDGAVRRVKGVDRRNPQWMLARQSAEMAANIEAELGLPPSRRHRVGKAPRRCRHLKRLSMTFAKPSAFHATSS
jgi:P27 family predicted phage terminase small subunit